ncbi:MAG: hypothetical protein JNK58_13850 [Phycisphaerae bacterium]|nr:hypothetical protein [Phycisphaerae bacterium]
MMKLTLMPTLRISIPLRRLAGVRLLCLALTAVCLVGCARNGCPVATLERSTVILTPTTSDDGNAAVVATVAE